MMILCIRDILDWVDSHPKFQYVLRVAYLEVYNECINDLLGAKDDPKHRDLKII